MEGAGEFRVEYGAVDFMSGMLAGATKATNIIKVLQEHPGFEPILFCDGPHMLGPVLVMRKLTRKQP